MDKQESQEDDKTMQKLQAKLSNYQVSPPTDAWQHINQKVNGTQLSEPFYKTIIGKASLGALILTGILLWWFYHSSEQVQLKPTTNVIDSTKLNTAQSEAAKVERINVQQNVSTKLDKANQTKRETQIHNPVIPDKTIDSEQMLLETAESIHHEQLPSKDTAEQITTKPQKIKNPSNFYESVRQDTNIKKQNLFVPK